MRNPTTPFDLPVAPMDDADDAALLRITRYQLDALAPDERRAVQHDLANDPDFLDAVEPVLTAHRAYYERVQRERLADRPRTEARLAQIHQAIAADVARARRGSVVARARGWARRWLLRVLTAAGAWLGLLWGLQLYTAELRAQHVPPASVTFVNAPLSAVVADIRARYDVDIQICDAGYGRDRVTLTTRNVPIDSVLHVIADQTWRWARWHGERTVRLLPYPDLDRGVWYNVALFLRGYSTVLGCHP